MPGAACDREYQPVKAELSVIGCITKIAAVGPERVPFSSFFVSAGRPSPRQILPADVDGYETPASIWRSRQSCCPLRGRIRRGSAVGFHPATRSIFNGPFRHRRERLILINTGIHRTNDIGRRRVRPTAFILNRARRIGGFSQRYSAS